MVCYRLFKHYLVLISFLFYSSNRLFPESRHVLSFPIKLIFCVILVVTANTVTANTMSFSFKKGVVECSSCGLIVANGKITLNTPKKFRTFLGKQGLSNNKKYTVVLNSNGGSLSGGLRLGRIIRSHGMNTHIASLRKEKDRNKGLLVSGICASSCAFVFLGGDNRSMHSDSKFGLHQISINSNKLIPINQAVEATQAVIAEITEYVKEMGVSSSVVSAALETDASNIDWINHYALTEMNVVNSDSLFLQEDWEFVEGARAWSNWSVLPDGTKALYMLICPSSLTKKDFDLVVDPYYRLDSKSPFYRSYIDFNIEVGLKKELYRYKDNVTIYYSGGKGAIHSSIPQSLIKQAILSNQPILVSASFPRVISKAYKVKQYEIPFQGLDEVFETARYICPDIFR